MEKTTTKQEDWQTILFADGSNPYICKTQKEFDRIERKYKLKRIKEKFFIAEELKNGR